MTCSIKWKALSAPEEHAHDLAWTASLMSSLTALTRDDPVVVAVQETHLIACLRVFKQTTSLCLARDLPVHFPIIFPGSAPQNLPPPEQVDGTIPFSLHHPQILLMVPSSLYAT